MRRSILFHVVWLALVSILPAYIFLYNRIEQVDTSISSSYHHLESSLSFELTNSLDYVEPPILLASRFENVTNDKRVLILARSKHSPSVLELTRVFEYNRVKYKLLVEHRTRSSIQLGSQKSNRSFYSLLVVDSLPPVVDSVRDECARLRIGIVYVSLSSRIGKRLVVGEEPNSCRLVNDDNDLWQVTQPSRTNPSVWFASNASETIVYEQTSDFLEPLVECGGRGDYLVLRTRNKSRLRQVVVGSRLDEIAPSIVLDLIDYASYARIQLASRDRFVQIDVDDVFVAKSGLRMRADDVHEMIRFQNEFLNKRVFDSSSFRFNLGYSGFYFGSGNRDENLADQLLIGIYLKTLFI